MRPKRGQIGDGVFRWGFRARSSRELRETDLFFADLVGQPARGRPGSALAAPESEESIAQSTIFVVRHAERTDTPTPGGPLVKPSSTDPDLSAAGRARAESLAFTLRNSGITAIYVTTLKRTQQTAAPLAKALNLTPTALAHGDSATLMQRLREHRGAALVVGHSETVSKVVKGLGVKELVAVAESEFDHLFVVVRAAAGDPTLLRLSYK